MQLSWLSVLSNIAPPFLRHKAATDNMLHITEDHPNWPVYADVFEHPPPQLASRRPVWSDMTSVDTFMQWREDWLLCVVWLRYQRVRRSHRQSHLVHGI